MRSDKPRYYEFGEFRLDTRQRTLSRNGETIPLSGRIFDLLVYLIENEGRILDHDELLDNVWHGTFVEQSNLKKGIWTLRKVLEAGEPEDSYIKTVPRRGYSFVAPVRPFADEPDQAVRLSETEIILEREEIDDRAPHGFLEAGRGRSYKAPIAISILALITIGTIGYWLGVPGSLLGSSRTRFEKAQLTRLTSIGNLVNVVISPNGEYAAYATHADDGQGLWLKHIPSGNTRQIIPTADAAFHSWNFTPAGDFIYFARKSRVDGSDGIFRIPFLGGDERKISDLNGANLCFSPDGSRFAFVSTRDQRLTIITADPDGTDETAVVSVDGRIWSLNWAPDGRSLIYTQQQTVGNATNYSAEEIPAGGGTPLVIIPSQRQRLYYALWTADKSGLILNAEDPETELLQLWFQPYPSGDRSRITNDLDSYQFFSFASRANKLVSMRTSFMSGVTVMAVDANEPQQIIPESSVAGNPVWAADDRIVYSSKETGGAEIWMTAADGTSKRQLTFDGNGNNFRPSVSRDGNTIVFTSTRSGKPQIWRMDSEGRNLTQLTDADAVSHGRIMPDGESIVYLAWAAPTGWTLFKKSPAEPEAVPITNIEVGAWDISPDGKVLAYEFLEKETGRTRVAVRGLEGVEPLKVFDFAVGYDSLRWTVDGRGLTYATKDEKRNKIMLQPVTGGEPREIADFGTKLIFWLDWSNDGRRLAVASGNHFNDAVMLKFD